MKTALKVVLWSLIIVTLGLVLFTCVAGVKSAPDAPKWEKAFDIAINIDLFWSYALLVLAVVGVLYAAIADMITHPGGLTKTLIAVGAVLVVVGTSVALVLSHDAPVITNSAGAVLDDKLGLRISEIGIFVGYIVGGITLLVVAYDVVSGLVRRFIK